MRNAADETERPNRGSIFAAENRSRRRHAETAEGNPAAHSARGELLNASRRGTSNRLLFGFQEPAFNRVRIDLLGLYVRVEQALEDRLVHLPGANGAGDSKDRDGIREREDR